ncbi:MAG: TetR family transcriptional regulator [Desulfobulbaceae bacterium]|nr:TetR family transcriptional regulator [Desulfobulbaceae bacterium]
MSQKETKQKLLDVAEELFAKNGYANTSLRAITGKAKANLAAVNYHFGSKEALLSAVLERRLLPLNRLRTERLEAVMAAAENEDRLPSAREVIAAFIEPTMAFRNSGKGAKSFVILISRALGDPDSKVRSRFINYIRPLFEYMGRCLALALPHLSEKDLFWRLHFMMGSLAHIMHGLDKEQMFPDEMVPADSSVLVDMLLDFLASGMEAGA